MTDAARDERSAGLDSDEAFDAAVPTLARLVRGYLTFARVSPDDLEDLAQEAILRLYLSKGKRSGRTVASLRAWLRVVCRNLALDARPKRTVTVEAEPYATPHEQLDLRQAIETGIDLLREPDGTVFRLRHVRGLDNREIAELYGWKVRNCEHVLARARATLERYLRRQGYEPNTRSGE